ncbi:unnamed protein product, partial [Choristocarpus tenellus]
VETLCIVVLGDSPAGEGRSLSSRLARRQLARGLKLLYNMMQWEELLSPEALAPVALGNLLGKRIAPALGGLAKHGDGGVKRGVPVVEGSVGGGGRGSGAGRGEALTLCERAVSLVPDEWDKRDHASANLAPLRIFVRLLGESLLSGDRREIERVARLQVSLGDSSAASSLARKHGLKIAK